MIKKLSIIDINEHLIEMYDLRYFVQQFGPEFIFLSSLYLLSHRFSLTPNVFHKLSEPFIAHAKEEEL